MSGFSESGSIVLNIVNGIYLGIVDQHGINSGEGVFILEVYNSVSVRNILSPVNFDFTVSGSVNNVNIVKSNASDLYVNLIRFGQYF